MSDQALVALAEEAGLQVEWEDAAGDPKTVEPDSLRAILQAMGLACGDAGEIADSRERLKAEAAAASASFVTATVGGPVELALKDAPPRARLVLEGGEAQELELEPAEGGVRFTAPQTPGYHRLEIGDRQVTVAVAPPACFTVEDAAPGRRLWGAAVQVYSLRDRRAEPFGDFGALEVFAREIGGRGADALAISPVHALFAADASRYSPYAPSTRLFLNGLYADPAAVFGEVGDAGDPGGELVDYAQAIPARLQRLRTLFDRFREGGDDARRADFERFRRDGGPDLELHARFEALHARFFAESGAKGWRDWPQAFHDPEGPEVHAYAKAKAEEVEFHLFLQWLADRSLAKAQAAAKAAGMAVGLIADLAVGMDAGGSHAWSRRDDLLNGLSVGAPPDVFQPAGQDWGIAAFSPQALRRTGFDAFIATLRSAMAHAGGVRIDHAMGLRRLWLTPHGADAKTGAYLSYPFEDMLRLIALESHRARAIVVGEDLGTVPPGFREAMDKAAIMGMRVLWFERDGDTDAFTPPGEWSAKALALTTTHDLPTIAGWWCGRDIDWMVKLGKKGKYADEGEERQAREGDREKLWQACVDAGVAEGEAPPPDQPDAAVDAVLDYVARTPCELAIFPVEDLLGLPEQPNQPGTIDEHPNWRRRLAGPADALLQEPEVAARIERLNRDRPA